MYTAENLQTYLDGAYSLERIAADLSDSERTAMWIVERDGVAIGYALAGRAVVPHADVTANAIELHRFYLVREEQGAGLGSKLYAQVEQWLNAHVPPNDNSSAFEDVWLGVWSENVAAQRFYARCGFEKVGEYKFKVGDHYDHEFIMRRRRREHD